MPTGAQNRLVCGARARLGDLRTSPAKAHGAAVQPHPAGFPSPTLLRDFTWWLLPEALLFLTSKPLPVLSQVQETRPSPFQAPKPISQLCSCPGISTTF